MDWRKEEIEKIKSLKDYLDYLAESEYSEDDGTAEGRNIIKHHFYYQNKLKAIIDEIVTCYELYHDYEGFKNKKIKEEFKNKYAAISHILLASNDVKMEELEDE